MSYERCGVVGVEVNVAKSAKPTTTSGMGTYHFNLVSAYIRLGMSGRFTRRQPSDRSWQRLLPFSIAFGIRHYRAGRRPWPESGLTMRNLAELTPTTSSL